MAAPLAPSGRILRVHACVCVCVCVCVLGHVGTARPQMPLEGIPIMAQQ